TRPRREGLYLKAGFLSNMVMGFLIGLATFSLGIFTYFALTGQTTILIDIINSFAPPSIP
ncbi:MAG: hypothetical protein QW535_06230, partial [Candidatus Nezhaarchaeales archaeon]